MGLRMGCKTGAEREARARVEWSVIDCELEESRLCRKGVS
jgi:hypothetical protein